MERRQALKNIGLSFGSITMSSGIIFDAYGLELDP